MTESYNQNLLKVIKLTREMLRLADLGDRHRNDTGCGILYGILRDTAYRLKHLAEEECKTHQKAEKWK